MELQTVARTSTTSALMQRAMESPLFMPLPTDPARPAWKVNADAQVSRNITIVFFSVEGQHAQLVYFKCSHLSLSP